MSTKISKEGDLDGKFYLNLQGGVNIGQNGIVKMSDLCQTCCKFFCQTHEKDIIYARAKKSP
jgi:hypothetical protein